MGAEIGTMRVTEQIDALEVMATDPVHYLMVPRVWALVAMLPMLVLLGDAIGMFGGYLVSVVLMGANPVVYVENTFRYMDVWDLFSGPDQVGGLRPADRGDRLPEGLLHLRRRRGRGTRDDPGGGRRLDRHPDLRLLLDQDPLLNWLTPASRRR